jgi:hypothetical protein
MTFDGGWRATFGAGVRRNGQGIRELIWVLVTGIVGIEEYHHAEVWAWRGEVGVGH